MYDVEIRHADESRLHVKKRSRDFQRSKVYKAEEEAFASDLKVSPPKFRKMDALTAYVHKVYEHPKIRDIYPSAFSGWSGIEVADGRRRRHGGGDIDGITMPIWARRPWVVLHEVAHVITERVFPYEGGHSQNYCGVYLNLVRIILGKEAHEALCRSFAKHGVKVREHEPFIKKKRPANCWPLILRTQYPASQLQLRRQTPQWGTSLILIPRTLVTFKNNQGELQFLLS